MRTQILSAVAVATLLFASAGVSAQSTAPMSASTMSMPAAASSTKATKHNHHKKTKPAAASSAPQK